MPAATVAGLGDHFRTFEGERGQAVGRFSAGAARVDRAVPVRKGSDPVRPATSVSGPAQYPCRMLPMLVRRRHVDYVRVTSMGCRLSA
ncbi:hypothetical protein AQI95_10945 [Streptomyces yokosukanensis]|uniref:Uncharacterized protein n=1 Tax=Streptomyces yokosukanensis TaxID=67386 RepID=A0A117Q3T4_9ACTN|nr:hypothetical protein AQI95_10945 [Streptomyces yokosukanensis]